MKVDWTSITIDTMVNLWQSFLLYLPNLILGMLILIFGWFLATGLEKLTVQVLKKMKLDDFFDKEEWKKIMEKAKIKINVSKFVGSIVKWIISIIILWIATGIFGLVIFAEFMGDIIRYIPNVIVASLIFVVAVILADFLSKIVVVAMEKAKFEYTTMAGEIVRWSIWFFAIFAILIELRIARELILIFFSGAVALMVIAGGLAFGLGGKDIAAEVLNSVRKGLKK
ncbi:MAG: hypothetical protein KY054_02215 [Candidatus Nealsonbacteria bacterium]|nr:hypothetical protein [Candidatus Nealsonbacteria bacterium]